MGIGMQELMIILLIVVIFYGGKKLPEIGNGLGRAISNFRKATSEPEEVVVERPAKKAETRKESPIIEAKAETVTAQAETTERETSSKPNAS
jgi:sec-independent protein translocase protein TatA